MNGAARESMKVWKASIRPRPYFTSGATGTYLVLRSSLLSESLDGWDADSQMVASDEVDLSLLDERPDLWLLQVVKLVLVGSGQMRDHGPVVTGDDDTTTASGLSIVDTVFRMDTSLVASLLENIGVLVTTNASDVHDGLRGEDVLWKEQVVSIAFQYSSSNAPNREETSSVEFLPEHHEQCSEQHLQQSASHCSSG